MVSLNSCPWKNKFSYSERIHFITPDISHIKQGATKRPGQRFAGTEGRSGFVDPCRHFWKTMPESKSVIVSLAGMSKLSLGNVNLPQSWGRFLSSGCSQYGSSVTVTFEWVGFVITNTKLFSLDFLWFLLEFLILHFFDDLEWVWKHFPRCYSNPEVSKSAHLVFDLKRKDEF